MTTYRFVLPSGKSVYHDADEIFEEEDGTLVLKREGMEDTKIVGKFFSYEEVKRSSIGDL